MANLLYERIEIMAGSPVLRTHSLCVEDVIDMLASGSSMDDVLAEYDGLELHDVLACLEYAYAK